MTAIPSDLILFEASSRERLLEHFASRFKHLTWRQIQQRFDGLLQNGYADARQDFDGKWRFVLLRREGRR